MSKIGFTTYFLLLFISILLLIQKMGVPRISPISAKITEPVKLSTWARTNSQNAPVLRDSLAFSAIQVKIVIEKVTYFKQFDSCYSIILFTIFVIISFIQYFVLPIFTFSEECEKTCSCTKCFHLIEKEKEFVHCEIFDIPLFLLKT